jgi:hypothetical protein
MLESARKHGPFDHRYHVRQKLPAPSWDLRLNGDTGERIEWSAFLARFFPNRRRHDFAALAAYEAYMNSLEQETRRSDRRRAERSRAAAMVDLAAVRRPRRRARACRSQPRQQPFWPGSRRVARGQSDWRADEDGNQLPCRVPRQPERERERGSRATLPTGRSSQSRARRGPDPTGSGCNASRSADDRGPLRNADPARVSVRRGLGPWAPAQGAVAVMVDHGAYRKPHAGVAKR